MLSNLQPVSSARLVDQGMAEKNTNNVMAWKEPYPLPSPSLSGPPCQWHLQWSRSGPPQSCSASSEHIGWHLRQTYHRNRQQHCISWLSQCRQCWCSWIFQEHSLQSKEPQCGHHHARLTNDKHFFTCLAHSPTVTSTMVTEFFSMM